MGCPLQAHVLNTVFPAGDSALENHETFKKQGLAEECGWLGWGGSKLGEI